MKHSVFSTCGALSFIACAAVAQTPQYTLETSAADSVPQTTIVPVQQAPVQVVEHTTVYEEPAAGMDRAQRRAYKAGSTPRRSTRWCSRATICSSPTRCSSYPAE